MNDPFIKRLEEWMDTCVKSTKSPVLFDYARTISEDRMTMVGAAMIKKNRKRYCLGTFTADQSLERDEIKCSGRIFNQPIEREINLP